MMLLLCSALIISCLNANYVQASICDNPTITSTSYTTQDGMVVREVAFISEFNLHCDNNAVKLTLYGEIEGQILPVMQVDGREKYQISWTEEVQKARGGEYRINVYDEDGYAALRKAIRSGDDLKSVEPIGSLNLRYPGAYLGPWLNSEFLAAVLLMVSWYVAYLQKSKIVA